jgi:hypothetical protein
MDNDKTWFSFHATAHGGTSEMMELPIRAETPEGAAAVLRVLLENRPRDMTQYQIQVRVDL